MLFIDDTSTAQVIYRRIWQHYKDWITGHPVETRISCLRKSSESPLCNILLGKTEINFWLYSTRCDGMVPRHRGRTARSGRLIRIDLVANMTDLHALLSLRVPGVWKHNYWFRSSAKPSLARGKRPVTKKRSTGFSVSQEQGNRSHVRWWLGYWKTHKSEVLLNSLLFPLHVRTVSQILECIEIGLLILQCSKYIQHSSLKVNVDNIIGYRLCEFRSNI